MASNVLEYVHRFHLPRIRVQTLNGFRVYRDDHRMKDEEWGGSLPQSLLKAIITRGGRQIPKERIIEDLWPGAPQSASETNFKVNLHRLRRMLEPSMLKELGSSYIRLKGNLVSLDEELFEIDVDNFTELIRKANKPRSKGDTKYAIRCLSEAIKLYQGDFLEEDLYNEAIRREREKLRQRYAEAMFQLASLYEMKGALKKAEDLYKKIIVFDPFSETAHQKLMINCANRGRTSEAIQAYVKYKNALRAELDTEPDDITRSVYERILDDN
jgi:DNA-binding SARP family transcriptional activator